LISFWIDYGTSTINSDVQWRLPLALQLIIGLILGVGILFFPFSPRWLMSQNREADALKVLSRLRRLPPDHPVVEEEWREIKATVEFDRQIEKERYPQHINNGARGRFMIGLGGYRDLFRKGIFKRLWLGCALQFFQQFTGINAIIVSQCIKIAIYTRLLIVFCQLSTTLQQSSNLLVYRAHPYHCLLLE
jgi:hypothetical protein